MAINPTHRRQLAMMAAIERRMGADMRAELIRAMKAYVAQWEATGGFAPMPQHKAEVEAVVAQYVQVSVVSVGASVLDSGKSMHGLERRDFSATMARIARRYIMQEAVRQRITSIADTTRNQIIAAVARGFEDGLGQTGIAGLILDSVAEIATQRAYVIARTETHGAANYGAYAAADETGLDLNKEWISAEDERTRESHAEANGQVQPMESPFIVGGEALMYPGDPSGSAANVINCRCTVGYIPKGV